MNNEEKLEAYKQQLMHTDPIFYAYYTHKENVIYAVVSFIAAFSVFIFSKAPELTVFSKPIDILFLCIVAAIYIVSLRFLYLQIRIRDGISVQCMAINHDLWLLSCGELRHQDIGLDEKTLAMLNAQYGMTQSNPRLRFFTKTYAETIMKSHSKFVFKGMTDAIMAMSILISILTLAFFASKFLL
ncbi:hypothetical protein F9L33_14630 [Amylibacter sp. SFDW26]|uniref:hypothetical protein n=1 Tax=Amylibacter sp. SFDW26 TaxID=2652722 RepID=UPI0012626B0D|nr:hypothetical protein [Amylibacter sp. SFDW26]KAB7610128.1 hypothetical protein F9L33_14630 [Amylibacter sp. SFDW26]